MLYFIHCLIGLNLRGRVTLMKGGRYTLIFYMFWLSKVYYFYAGINQKNLCIDFQWNAGNILNLINLCKAFW